MSSGRADVPFDALAGAHPMQRLDGLAGGSGADSSERGPIAPLLISPTTGAKLRRIAIEPGREPLRARK